VVGFFVLCGLLPSLFGNGELFAESVGRTVAILAGIALLVWLLFRRRFRWPGGTRVRDDGASHRAELRQNLRLKVMYDEAKIDRLIDFERDERKRKGLREASVEDLMQAAIERWERDNASTAPLF
jgi:hypothetical protein